MHAQCEAGSSKQTAWHVHAFWLQLLLFFASCLVGHSILWKHTACKCIMLLQDDSKDGEVPTDAGGKQQQDKKRSATSSNDEQPLKMTRTGASTNQSNKQATEYAAAALPMDVDEQAEQAPEATADTEQQSANQCVLRAVMPVTADLDELGAAHNTAKPCQVALRLNLLHCSPTHIPLWSGSTNLVVAQRAPRT